MRETMYKNARFASHKPLKLMEGAFFSTLKLQYHVTLELVLEMSWDSLQASIMWREYELARVTAQRP